MKNMKKIVALILIALVVMPITAGCGSSSNSNKKYKIATETAFPPFDFTDSNGKFGGIDIEILDAIAKDQGFEYELQKIGFDASLLAVQTGQADGVLAGMSITEERKKKFDFSNAYYEAEVTLAVAAGSDIKSLEDLKGKKVAVKTATNGANYAKSISDQYGFSYVEFKDSPTMYQDVITGNTVACFEDYPVMAYNIKNGAKMEIPEGLTAAGSPYGFAVAKDKNGELMEKFNKGLENIKKNGKYQEIIDKYTK